MAVQVLLVDDDAAVLTMLQAIFQSRKFEVCTAACAREAVAALAKRTFDLVVTDMRMESPVAGYDVIEAARVHASKPIIAILSAYPIPTPEWQQAGADAMFLKGEGGPARMLDDLAELVQRRQVQGKAAAVGEPRSDRRSR